MKRLLGLLLVMVGCEGGTNVNEEPVTVAEPAPSRIGAAETAKEVSSHQDVPGHTAAEVANLTNQVNRNEKGEVLHVDLEEHDFGDAEMAQLAGFTQLETLNLIRTQVTDVGLWRIREFNRLEMLFLDGTQITDTGLESLKAMSGLEVLHLSDTRLNGTVLIFLEGMNKLRGSHLA